VSNNAYPAALTDLTAGTAPILKSVPADPKGGTGYTYEYTPTPTGGPYTAYTLNACMENAGDTGTSTIAAVSPCTTRTFQLVNNN